MKLKQKELAGSLTSELDQMTVGKWSSDILAHLVKNQTMPDDFFEEWVKLTEQQKDVAFFNAWGIIWGLVAGEDDNEVIVTV